jgi:hypothetical protein
MAPDPHSNVRIIALQNIWRTIHHYIALPFFAVLCFSIKIIPNLDRSERISKLSEYSAHQQIIKVGPAGRDVGQTVPRQIKMKNRPRGPSQQRFFQMIHGIAHSQMQAKF